MIACKGCGRHFGHTPDCTEGPEVVPSQAELLAVAKQLAYRHPERVKMWLDTLKPETRVRLTQAQNDLGHRYTYCEPCRAHSPVLTNDAEVDAWVADHAESPGHLILERAWREETANQPELKL